MSRAPKTALVVSAISLFMASLVFSQIAKPAFTPKDREQIEAYYNHVIGTLAPGSLDRSSLGPAVEKALATGSRLPMQLEKDLEPLPAKLDSHLSQITGDYGRFKVGRHVVLLRKTDLLIADIMKNIAVKEPAR